jgi:hypothetical protein
LECDQESRTPLTSILPAASATLRFGFFLDHICHRTVRSSSVYETPTRNQHNFGCVLPVLTCVLNCACKHKPSWRGYSCVTDDSQWSSGVVIAWIRSLGALDHRRRDLYPIKIPYLKEDRAFVLYQEVSIFRLSMRYNPTFRFILFVP